MRTLSFLSFAALAVPTFASAADENVTPRLRGALIEFESGATYAFHPRGGFVMTLKGESWRGKWKFKPDRSAYCSTVTMSTGPETSCSRIVKRGEQYVQLSEAGDAGSSTITSIKFNRFRK